MALNLNVSKSKESFSNLKLSFESIKKHFGSLVVNCCAVLLMIKSKRNKKNFTVINITYVIMLYLHQTQIPNTNTKHKYKKMKSWTDPTSSIPSKSHPLGRQGKKRVTNSRAAAYRSWMVECSPRAQRF